MAPKHLPQPSYAPVLMAAGLMFELWGTVTSWIVSGAGFLVVGIASFRWIRDLRQGPRGEVAEPKQRASEPARRSILGTRDRVPVPYFGRWLHRYTLLLAFCTLAAVITGALVTSHATSVSAQLEQIHLGVAAAVGILAIGMAVWLSRAERQRWVRRLGWIVLAGVIAEAALGNRNPTAGTFHALLAQLFFALAIAVSVVTSRGWTSGVARVKDSSRVSLRSLSAAAAALAVLQVSLGAAVRHQAMGVATHITGALVVTLVILLLGVLVTQQFPEHRTLAPAAKVLMGITFVQVMLGMGAFITRMMAEEASPAVAIPSVAHVATASLTLGATVVLALEIGRHVAPRGERD